MKDYEERELGFLATVAFCNFVCAAMCGWIATSHFGDWLGHVTGIVAAFFIIAGIVGVRRYRIRARELRK